MSILRDERIEELALWSNMIVPFVDNQVSKVNEQKIISYGLSSYGYDIRNSNEYKIFTNVNSSVLDAREFDQRAFVEHTGDFCIIPPNSFVLTRSVECLKIPRNILVICLGKSTLARMGLVIGITPLEPEWEGHVTIEISNTTPLPAKIYSNEGIAQLVFFESEKPCAVSYKDRKGKYQNQSGITLPKT